MHQSCNPRRHRFLLISCTAWHRSHLSSNPPVENSLVVGILRSHHLNSIDYIHTDSPFPTVESTFCWTNEIYHYYVSSHHSKGKGCIIHITISIQLRTRCGPSMRISHANSSTLRPLTIMIYDPRISGHPTKKKNTRFHLLANANGVNPVLTYTESVTWWTLTQQSGSGILLILLATISIISSRSHTSWSWSPLTAHPLLFTLQWRVLPTDPKKYCYWRIYFCQHHELLLSTMYILLNIYPVSIIFLLQKTRKDNGYDPNPLCSWWFRYFSFPAK